MGLPPRVALNVQPVDTVAVAKTLGEPQLLPLLGFLCIGLEPLRRAVK